MPNAEGNLTTRERAFAVHMAGTGDAHYAAAKAGYAFPAQDAHKNLRKSAVNAEIAALCQAELHNELRPLANSRLRRILEDDNIAPQHHIAAAKVVIGACKDFLDPTSGKSVAEMNPAELQAAIDRVGLLLGKGEATTIEAEPGVFD